MKERKKEIQKFEYLEIEKSFLDEVKGIVHNFLRAIVWQKKRQKLVAYLSFIPVFLYKKVCGRPFTHMLLPRTNQENLTIPADLILQ